MAKLRKHRRGYWFSGQKNQLPLPEKEEEKRELEAREVGMESKQEMVERTIEKRFLQKQPPRKRGA